MTFCMNLPAFNMLIYIQFSICKLTSLPRPRIAPWPLLMGLLARVLTRPAVTSSKDKQPSYREKGAFNPKAESELKSVYTLEVARYKRTVYPKKET